MSAEREFAFGENEYAGCYCPSMEAGVRPGMYQDVCRVALQYDTYVRMELWEELGNDYSELPDCADYWLRENTDLDRGTIPEETAKRCWAKAIEAQMLTDRVRLITERLGWEDVLEQEVPNV